MPNLAPEVWFPTVTLLIGFGFKSFTDWLQERRTKHRETETRKSEKRDRLEGQRTEFQRSTLLELQDAVMQLARATGAANHQDVMAFRSSNKWQKQLLTNDLSETVRLGQASTARLVVRVRDETVRGLTAEFKKWCDEATRSESKEAAEHAMATMATTFEALNERIGTVLRKLDDAEDEQR